MKPDGTPFGTRKSTYIISCAILTLIGAVFLYPLVITITNSFMTESEISMNYSASLTIFDVLNEVKAKFIEMKLIPNEVSGQQYLEVLIYQPSFMVLLLNSVKLTLPVVIGNTLVSLLAAYGFTIWKFRFKEALFFVYIIVMLMPLQAVLVPNYIVADLLKIKDSYLAIILPGVFAPFGTFLLRQSMKSIPNEYIEAAEVDGANKFYIFMRIIVPQMKSGIAALAMLVFIEYWNLVEQSVIFIKDYYREPLSVYLSRIADGKVALVFAASCVYLVPPLWFLCAGQKDLEKGIELSGIK